MIRNAHEAALLLTKQEQDRRLKNSESDVQKIIAAIEERAKIGFTAIELDHCVNDIVKVSLERLGFEVDILYSIHAIGGANRTTVSWFDAYKKINNY